MRAVRGRVLTGQACDAYAADAGPYRIRPREVVIPKDEADVVAAVRYAARHRLSITARSAGTGLCGAAVGRGLVIDFSSLNRVLRRRGSHVRVEPGIVYDDLNRSLKTHGLLFWPSSCAQCSVGGNVSTKASGIRGVKYGSIDRPLRGVRFVDARGRVVDTAAGLPEDLATAVLRVRKRLLQDRKALAVLRARRGLKTSLGYNLYALTDYDRPEEMVTHLFAGSVGTLGLLTAIDLELDRVPARRATCLASFASAEAACAAVPRLLPLRPSAIEILDSSAFARMRERLPQGTQAVLLIELDQDLQRTAARLRTVLQSVALGSRFGTGNTLWEIRTSMLREVGKTGLVVPFVEDLSVPVDRLAPFLRDLKQVFARRRVRAVIYGHAAEGNLHIRPLLGRARWMQRAAALTEECFALTFRYGGSISAEHGAGRSKSPYLEREWGPASTYFAEVKRIFDPAGRLNPDVLFTKRPITRDVVLAR
ncbi:MAG: FAD-binding oxidoreductase [Candidatus Aenigmarchaeota archaeon]|nr:FAD-binding oxidoreductase [Candidatus Aenigmarchaeota archaeon]